MPAELQSLIDNLQTGWQSFYLTGFSAINIGFQNLGNAILANNWVNAHAYCDQLATDWNTGFRNRLTLSTQALRYYILESLYWINSNWTTGGVTMDDILNAMLAAKFSEIEKFIGLEEAFRMSLWNAPFNADMYAALGRGFAKWPEP